MKETGRAGFTHTSKTIHVLPMSVMTAWIYLRGQTSFMQFDYNLGVVNWSYSFNNCSNGQVYRSVVSRDSCQSHSEIRTIVIIVLNKLKFVPANSD